MAAQRSGACTPGCGACCRWLLLQVNPAYAAADDVAHWIALHGITLLPLDGGIYARIPLPCRELTPAGGCALFDDPRRPALCGRFPLGPRDLAGLTDVCTYAFEENVND